jgi:hypothetical protein
VLVGLEIFEWAMPADDARGVATAPASRYSNSITNAQIPN